MRKICVVTGTRAEYGLLRWLLQEISDDAELELQLVVTGAHLSADHGNTVAEIERDGFVPTARVEMPLADDSSIAVARSVGVATAGLAEAFAELAPDVVVILGDRYEIFAAAQAAMLLRVPIAHLHGGEASEGAIDEAIRHAITKMSHFHFVAAGSYKRRVEQLGEDPARVFNYGAPGLDNLSRLTLMGSDEIAADLAVPFADPTFLVTYHPATLDGDEAGDQARMLIAALDRFSHSSIIFTMANADSGGQAINEVLREYASANSARMGFFKSLGQLRYLSALRHCDVAIGNSSSGLLEAPSVGTATVNIGDRQRGRESAQSVIDCPLQVEVIVASIEKALSDEFRAALPSTINPYGGPGASARIKDELKSVDLDGVLKKRFHDVAYECVAASDGAE